MAMESEAESAAGLLRAGGAVSSTEDVVPTATAEVLSDEADTISTAVYGGEPSAAGDVAAVTDVERRDQPGGASAPSSGGGDATTAGSWGAPLLSAEGAEMDAEPLQQFHGASAELEETGVSSTHGDEVLFSALSTPPLSASFTVVFLSLIQIIQWKYWVLLGEASCAGRQVPALCNTSGVEHPPGQMLNTESIIAKY